MKLTNHQQYLYKIKWGKEKRGKRKWFYIYTHACIDTVIEANKRM